MAWAPLAVPLSLAVMGGCGWHGTIEVAVQAGRGHGAAHLATADAAGGSVGAALAIQTRGKKPP